VCGRVGTSRRNVRKPSRSSFFECSVPAPLLRLVFDTAALRGQCQDAPRDLGMSQLHLHRMFSLVKSSNRFESHRCRWLFVFVKSQRSPFKSVKVFSGTSNQPLAKKICEYIGIELGKCVVSAFPDGETFVKIEENVRGEDVFLIQSTSPPSNHHLMEMFIMMDALRRASASRITAVLPFYGYARQDRKDQPRVPITAKLVANLLVAAGANRILAMDLHAQQIQGFFDIPVDHLYAAPVMYDYLKGLNVKDLVVVSPDVGGLKMAHAYSQVLDTGLAIVAKRRKSATEVESMTMIGEVRGKNVLMVDDLTETAGTLTSAAVLVKKKGAKRILACVSHAILNDIGIERLRKSNIDELITTDTVLRPAIDGLNITTLSVAGLLGEAISRINTNSSITSLFEFKGGRTS
jgi:ribose-phosphate pyrophosphokinase